MGYYSSFKVWVRKSAFLKEKSENFAKIQAIEESISVLDSLGVSTNELSGQLRTLKNFDYPEVLTFRNGYTLVNCGLEQGPQNTIFVAYETSEHCKWYSFIPDMNEFSEKYIGWTIQAERIGEDSGDYELYRFRDGKCETVKANLVYPVEQFGKKFTDDFPLTSTERA